MRGRTNLESVEITYYSDDGRVTVLTAESALYDENARNATLRGNVIVKTSDGGSLSTDSLEWDQEKEILRGEGKVRITRGGSIINGKGFELSPTDETFRIYEVGGTIHQGDWDL
jgi:LPS export ABC transporter protein LptC